MAPYPTGSDEPQDDCDAPQRIARRGIISAIGAAVFANALTGALRSAAAASTAPALLAASQNKKARNKAVPNPIIVIDAGHGGRDPGTISVSAVQEKNLVLSMAAELRRQLAATGRYDTALTRDSDVFVPLNERVDIARRAKGNLFISLHADAIDHPQTRGACVYTLSEHASDAIAAALAEKENVVDSIAGVDLNSYSADVRNILVDLAKRDTERQSTSFVTQLLPRLQQETRLLDGSHRSANFAVLRAPDVPSVLIELGYLSNRDDDLLLKQASHRKHLARAMVAAVDAFFQHGPNTAS